MQVPIQRNKRLTFMGKTRSGKSFLAWYLLRIFSKNKRIQVVFLDPKHEHKKFGDGASLDKPKLVKKYDAKVQFQIFQEFNWNDELEHMVTALLSLKDNYDKGKSQFYGAIFVLDELGGIASATTVPTGITRLWTQGGGKNVGAWSMLQFPTRTPKVIKSQTEIFFLFRINSANDRKDMLEFIPDERIVNTRLPKHYFWLYSDDMDTAIKVKPIQVKESQKPV